MKKIIIAGLLATTAFLPLYAQKAGPAPIVYDGLIAEYYPVRVVLAKTGNKVEGFYYYKKYARPIVLKGTEVKGKITLREYIDEYDKAGSANFELTITGNRGKGFWYREAKFNKVTALTVNLTKADLKLTPLKISSKEEAQQIQAEHLLSIQWISTDWYGEFFTHNFNGYLFAMGIQNGVESYEDSLTLEGTITEIKNNAFVFNGDIKSTISYNNNGKTCHRKGLQEFKRTGERRYYRLQKMQQCADTDYIDVYLPNY